MDRLKLLDKAANAQKQQLQACSNSEASLEEEDNSDYKRHGIHQGVHEGVCALLHGSPDLLSEYLKGRMSAVVATVIQDYVRTNTKSLTIVESDLNQLWLVLGVPRKGVKELSDEYPYKTAEEAVLIQRLVDEPALCQTWTKNVIKEIQTSSQIDLRTYESFFEDCDHGTHVRLDVSKLPLAARVFMGSSMPSVPTKMLLDSVAARAVFLAKG